MRQAHGAGCSSIASADAQKRIVIGDATATDLDAARKKARQYRVALDNQKDPAAEKINKLAAAELTFSKVVDKYLEVRATDMRPQSPGRGHPPPKRGMEVAPRLPAGQHHPPDHRNQTARDYQGQRPDRRQPRPRHAVGHVRLGIGEGLCESNPVEGTNKNKENTRDRVLTDAELAKIWLAAPDNGYGRIVKLLMLTAQRRDEIGYFAGRKSVMRSTEKGPDCLARQSYQERPRA